MSQSQAHGNDEDFQQDYAPSEHTVVVHDDDIDPVAEKKLLRKLDLALLPLFILLYLANFIDRAAVGNAKIAGLEEDLNLEGSQYNIALTLFFVAYIVAEVPSNLVLKNLGSTWLAILVIGFGAVTISSAFMQNFIGLVLTRVFLGLAEGGLYPGLMYILGRYYRRTEFVFRVGVYFPSPTLANAFGSLLASGLVSIHPIGSVTSWRKIFLVEGIITTVIGILCLFLIPADPKHSRLLTKDERVLALKRIAVDGVVKSSQREKTSFSLLLRACNFNTSLISLMYMLNNISFQGLTLFMPTVVATLGHFSTVDAQLRTVPPYLASAVVTIAISYLSLRTQRRAPWIILSALLTVSGYAIFVASIDSHARYAACFLAISGAGASAPVLMSWATDNAAPETVRAVITALIPGVGSLGAIVAVWTYIPTDAPHYHQGNSLNLASSSAICILTLIGVRYIYWENAKRDLGERDHRLKGKSQEEIEELGSRHPGYRYRV